MAAPEKPTSYNWGNANSSNASYFPLSGIDSSRVNNGYTSPDNPTNQELNEVIRNAYLWQKYFEYALDHPNWTSATELFTDTTAGTSSDPKIAAMSPTTFAWIDDNVQRLRLYSIDGTQITMVGAEFTIAFAADGSICSLSATDVVVHEPSSTIRRYTNNGAAWSLVGATHAYVGSRSTMSALSATDFAFVDDTVQELVRFTNDGSAFSVVGNELVLGAITRPQVTTLGENSIAYYDDTNQELRRYDNDGTDWTLIAATDLSSFGFSSTSMTALNETDVAFVDNLTNTLRIFRLDVDTNVWDQLVLKSLHQQVLEAQALQP